MKKQFFPFGRGDRGSQMRFFFQFASYGEDCRWHVFTVNVAQIAASSKVVFRMGTSKMKGKRAFFVFSDFKSLFKFALLGFKVFHEVRAINKLHKLRRGGMSLDAQRQKFYRMKGYV
jgi:hypothetical protein